MFPFNQVVPLIFSSLARALLDPLFWVVVLLVALQYRRMAAVKESFFGLPPGGVWRDTLSAAAYGVLGGLAGSFLMVLIGVTLSGSGLIYLWPVAILLMLINARFLCFAYAGGILALSKVLFGLPDINIAQVLALVAILHMVESMLILVSGHLGAVPAYYKEPGGRVVGGFALQRFWPIPIVALMVVGQTAVQQGVNMPAWWPLLKPAVPGNPANLIYSLIPVVAGLGYGDLAVSRRPGQKSRLSALFLGLYSLTLILLAVAAQSSKIITLLAALFSPLGHELVIHIGKKVEFRGRPVFTPDPRGLRVLEVLPGSPAWQAGMRSGDVLTTVNGWPVNSRQGLETALDAVPWQVEVEFLAGAAEVLRRETVRLQRWGQPFGILPVPAGDEEASMDLSTAGPLGRWWGEFWRRFRG
ncbi:signal protein PDZ [Desulfotomaculum copahuensis]|uniref:Signal protein PDZ n=1 Tax=Desulfotomaculum copahuensis TaxID=1838280 RepID=A0A1B7LC34_9FIRM|nr:PDZ domain-containing protein [Desulfotomaculum copahuensis]OAT80239.1 signal protein PDZ [Desulfotomaculum copahuensis]